MNTFKNNNSKKYLLIGWLLGISGFIFSIANNLLTFNFFYRNEGLYFLFFGFMSLSIGLIKKDRLRGIQSTEEFGREWERKIKERTAEIEEARKKIKESWQEAEVRQGISDFLREEAEEAVKQAEIERAKAQKALEELKIAQKDLVQSEKLAALGQLVANVAHEINSPIGAINSFIGNVSNFFNVHFFTILEELKNATDSDREAMKRLLELQSNEIEFLSQRQKRELKKIGEKYLEKNGIVHSEIFADRLVDMNILNFNEKLILIIKNMKLEILEKSYKIAIVNISIINIQTAVQRTSKIIFALKSYSAIDRMGEKRSFNIKDGIESVLLNYRKYFNQSVELITEYDDFIPKIICYPDELNQVFINIIFNALQSMEFKGILKIKVSKLESDLIISITDNGNGIATEIQSMVFNPFFTTKSSGEGSGLGLDISKRIIENHKGSISFDSVPGSTTFTIMLPMEEDLVQSKDIEIEGNWRK